MLYLIVIYLIVGLIFAEILPEDIADYKAIYGISILFGGIILIVVLIEYLRRKIFR